MNSKLKIWTYPLVLMIVLLSITNSCNKKDDTPSIKDPVITWANPADIDFGILLSATQLNAIADVPGTFAYTPAIGTKLNPGPNQDLKVDFTPSDANTYNSASKTVKINVIFPATTITDIDGNVYHTVTIGTQVWLVENLKTTKYNDGSSIPHIMANTTWINLVTPGYCWYNNDSATYKNTYGALYNWYAVNTGKLAPQGWHVPSYAEWFILFKYLGSGVGGKMKSTGTKEAGTGLWFDPNTGATNESGFTAVPAGFRSKYNTTFDGLAQSGTLWCSNEDVTHDIAPGMGMSYKNSGVTTSHYNKYLGFSVRCLRDF